jgi:cyclophilin family peptidyl-prolyl cis-trans isomerase/HEAT repeat protein
VRSRLPLLVTLFTAVLLHAGAAAASPIAAEHREVFRAIAIAEDRRDASDERLARSASDSAWAVRVRAAVALGRIQDAGSVPLLVSMLSDRNVSVKRTAAFALGQVGSAEAVPALLEAAGSPLDDVAERAIVALGKIHAPGTTPRIAEFLRHADPDRREAAAFALSRTADTSAVPSLIAALDDAAPAVRGQALHALERLADARGAEGALRLTRDQDPGVRYFAYRAVGRLGDSLAADARLGEALALGLRESDWRLRAVAARAAESTGTHLATPDLLTALRDPSTNVREAAVSALGGIRSLPPDVESRVREALAQLSSDPAPGIRFRAGVALAQRAGSSALAAARDANTATAAAPLQPFFDDPDPFVVGKVVASLGSGKDEGFHPLLRRLTTDERATVRAAALEGLSGFGDPDDEPLFTRAVGDADWVTATVAAGALGEAGTVASTPALREALAGRHGADETELRATAASALGTIGGRTGAQDDLPALRDALADEDFFVRRAAAEAITRVTGDTIVVEPRVPPDASYPADFGIPRGLETATIVTERGAIEIELFGDECPSTVASFVALARRGFYDGIRFHRVVPSFVAQAGCPRGDGWGSAGYTLRCEINERRYTTGAVGMAHAGKDTGGSQFFITHSPQHHLEGRYTLFGRVIAGQEVADSLTEQDRILRIETGEASVRGSADQNSTPASGVEDTAVSNRSR